MGGRQSKEKKEPPEDKASQRGEIVKNLVLQNTGLIPSERCTMLSRIYGEDIKERNLPEVESLITALINGENLNYTISILENDQIVPVGIAVLVEKYPNLAEKVIKINEMTFQNRVIAAKNEALDYILDGRMDDLSADKLAQTVKNLSGAVAESKKAGTPNVVVNVIGNVSSQEKRMQLNQFFAVNPLAARQLAAAKSVRKGEEILEVDVEDAVDAAE